MLERKMSHEELEQSYDDLKKIVYNLKPADLVEILRANHALLLFKSSDDNRSSLWEMLLYSKRSDLFIVTSHLAIELIEDKVFEKQQLSRFEYSRRGILSLAAVLGDKDVFNFCADYFCGLKKDHKLTCQNYSMSEYSSSMPDDTADYLFSHGAEGYSHSKMFESLVESMFAYHNQGHANIRLVLKAIFLLERNATLSDHSKLTQFATMVDESIVLSKKSSASDGKTQVSIVDLYYLRGLVAEQCEKNPAITELYYESASENGHISAHLRLANRCCLTQFQKMCDWLSAAHKINPELPLKRSEVAIAIRLVHALHRQQTSPLQDELRMTLMHSILQYQHDRFISIECRNEIRALIIKPDGFVLPKNQSRTQKVIQLFEHATDMLRVAKSNQTESKTDNESDLEPYLLNIILQLRRLGIGFNFVSDEYPKDITEWQTTFRSFAVDHAILRITVDEFAEMLQPNEQKTELQVEPLSFEDDMAERRMRFAEMKRKSSDSIANVLGDIEEDERKSTVIYCALFGRTSSSTSSQAELEQAPVPTTPPLSPGKK